jgi:hypothetical protein
MQRQYWVIGGEYDSIDFKRLTTGTSEVLGPFGSHHEATLACRERSLATCYRALMRYVIASNAWWSRAG